MAGDHQWITNGAVGSRCSLSFAPHSAVSTLLCRRATAESVLLEVRASNDPALALYASMGFRQVGLRKKYYSSPEEDAVLMTLALREGA